MDYQELSNRFDKLADFYWANKENIDTGHEKEFVLMYEMDVSGYFPSWDKAELYALRNNFVRGAFLIHQCNLQEEPERVNGIELI